MKQNNDRYLYIMGIFEDYNYYKIGFSKNVESRFRNIKTSIPFDIKLLFYIKDENASQTEFYLHQKYQSYNINGEWYKLENDHLLEAVNIMILKKHHNPKKFLMDENWFIDKNWFNSINIDNPYYEPITNKLKNGAL